MALPYLHCVGAFQGKQHYNPLIKVLLSITTIESTQSPSSTRCAILPFQGSKDQFPTSKDCEAFFKPLFIGTKLGDSLKMTTLTKAVSEGLKPQECEHGSSRNKPIIPCVPKNDKLQEDIETSASTIKLFFPHKVELRGSIWTSRTPE